MKKLVVAISALLFVSLNYSVPVPQQFSRRGEHAGVSQAATPKKGNGKQEAEKIKRKTVGTQSL